MALHDAEERMQRRANTEPYEVNTVPDSTNTAPYKASSVPCKASTVPYKATRLDDAKDAELRGVLVTIRRRVSNPSQRWKLSD